MDKFDHAMEFHGSAMENYGYPWRSYGKPMDFHSLNLTMEKSSMEPTLNVHGDYGKNPVLLWNFYGNPGLRENF